MDFTSTGFILFTAITVLIYYLVPQRIKWIILLIASYLFYAINNFKALFFIITSTLISYFGALLMSRIENNCNLRISNFINSTDDKDKQKAFKKSEKSNAKRKKKIAAIFTMTFIFGILAVLKYSNFVIESLNQLFNINNAHFKFILPLGISFYSFQIASYIFDVYYGKYQAEKNIFHYALYVCYFPSIVQGPINRYNDLKIHFFETRHFFNLETAQFAMQRILWGMLKKLVIADRAADVVTYLFNNHASLPWYMTWCGLLFYSIKLYADFSGAMDVTIGISNLFGISLQENFRQPFFSQSIAEFWRRWHITLGTWMKDYIFYPFSLSKFSGNITKFLSEKNKFLARAVPSCLGNLIVFFIVGVWHGAEWHYIVYGLYNALIIIFGIILKPFFERLSAFFHIETENRFFKLFRIVRTFILVNIGWVFDDNTTGLDMSFSMIRQAFSFNTGHLSVNYNPFTYTELTLVTVIFFSAIWFLVSLKKEKGINVLKKISEKHLIVRWIIYIALIMSTPFFQASKMAGFIYAQF